MIISRAVNVDHINYRLKIRDELIEDVKIVKYLGIIIDNKLKFEEHIEYTVNKIAKNWSY